MTIIYISDFDLRGSGYCNLSLSLCTELVNRGREVLALGIGYKRTPHNYPFSIVPIENLQQIYPVLLQLKAQGVDIEALVVALDIPLQEMILDQIKAPGEWPYIGLFPLEAGPLCGTWALNLLKMDARLIMSKFGQEELAAKGVDSDFIPLGVTSDVWRPPYEQERAEIRQARNVDDDTFVILTVADNQERKNLSRSLEIFADFAKDRKALYWLVTRPDAAVGWKLEDYAMELGCYDKVQLFRRGMPTQVLWSLYAAADCFLLTSKAEGLAIPILEAMACRLPCVGTKCAAIEEHLSDDRGLLIEPDYIYIDPFGNARRYLASREDGAYKLQLLKDGFSAEDYQRVMDSAEVYIKSRTWQEAGGILDEAIDRAIRGRGIQQVPDPIPESYEQMLEPVA